MCVRLRKAYSEGAISASVKDTMRPINVRLDCGMTMRMRDESGERDRPDRDERDARDALPRERRGVRRRQRWVKP